MLEYDVRLSREERLPQVSEQLMPLATMMKMVEDVDKELVNVNGK